MAIRADGTYIDPDSIWSYDARSLIVPLNRSYDELTDQEKQRYLRAVGGIPAGDEPPFPKLGMKIVVQPLIATRAAYADVKGLLHAVATVDEWGTAVAVRVERSPTPDLTRAILVVLASTRFKPAICSGKPCARDFSFTMQFGGRM